MELTAHFFTSGMIFGDCCGNSDSSFWEIMAAPLDVVVVEHFYGFNHSFILNSSVAILSISFFLNNF